MKKLLLASVVSATFAVPAFAADQADVVVVGAGGAGLSAAVTAHNLGKKVIVLEKNDDAWRQHQPCCRRPQRC